MKKRKKLIKRIGSILCALFLVVGCLGSTTDVRAELSYKDYTEYAQWFYDHRSTFETHVCDYMLPSGVGDNVYYYVGYMASNNTYYMVVDNSPIELYVSKGTFNSSAHLVSLVVNCPSSTKYYKSKDGVNWSTTDKIVFTQRILGFYDYPDDSRDYVEYSWKYVGSNCPMKLQGTDLTIFDIGPSYNSALGYLQNVKHNVVFDDVPLGENVGETFTERWYYDSFSTTGVDLSSGDYVIRYYQEKWIVTGYSEYDVVHKSTRYVLGDYIVQNGYIEAYSESIESTLAGQGYEEPSVFDLLWNKFVTTHYYFQIVNTKTNEVGGLLHVYLTDDNGKFGVEHVGETLDNNGNYDEGGYKDFIDEDKVTTDDVEQGFDDLENGSNVDFGTVDGVDEFGVTLESFASQVSNVTGGVHALLSSMPPWVLGLLGVSFVLLVVGLIFKIV